MKKKVDVYCGRAFSIGLASFAGKCINIILDTDAIRMCILNKARVWELTSDGKRIPLDFTNYDKDNGGVVPEKTRTEYDPKNKETKVTRISFDGDTPVVKKDEKKKPVTVTEKVLPTKKEEKKETVIEEKKVEVKASVDVDAKATAPEKKEEQHDNKYNNNNKYNNKYNNKK